DIAELGVKIDTSSITQGDKALDNFSKTAGKAERSAGDFTSSVKGMTVALAAVATALAAFDIAKKLYDTAAAAERLNITFKFSFGAQAEKELKSIRKLADDLGLQF